jgi:leader peptidase (prepilin peptidase)/N-methyltransferase
MIALLAPFTAVTGVFGLLFGSFFNVVIWRVPRRESVVRPASSCPKCGHAIRAWDNIPVLSWLLLRGKCRDCGTSISAQYPAVELVTGFAFALVALGFVPAVLNSPVGATQVSALLEMLAFLALAAASVVLSGIDLTVQRLPDRIVVPTFVVGALLLGGAALAGADGAAMLRALIGSAAAFLFFLIVAFIKPGAMGMGDVKLAAVLGLYLGYLGWSQLVVGFFAAFIVGSIAGLLLLIARRVDRKGGIPFGPWMFAGAWVGIAAGGPIAAGYLHLVGLA